jgi:hypothetical protein
MKMILTLTITILLIAGCKNTVEPDQNNKGVAIATFVALDTSGHISTVFHKGVPFNLYFFLKNTTQDTITYTTADGYYPSVIFIISNGSTKIWEPCIGHHMVTTWHIYPGDSLQGLWQVPDTISIGSWVAQLFLPPLPLDHVSGSSTLSLTIAP